jgi:hypothetical protein
LLAQGLLARGRGLSFLVMGIEDQDERRLQVRRGAEHVRIEDATEELGEIVPPPVLTDDEDEAERRRRESEG